MITKIKNKEELRSRVGVNFATIILLGIDEVGDGKGGLFYWNGLSTHLDDNLNTFKVTNVETGRWKRVYSSSLTQEQIDYISQYISENSTFITNIINNNYLTESIVSQLNFEVQDINGKTLFFTFDPKTTLINIEKEKIDGEIVENETLICQLPTSVNILGNINPNKNSTEVYNLDIVDGQNLSYIWTVTGGDIIGSNKTNTLTVEWKTSEILSSVNVAIVCDVENIMYDFNFFVLKE